MNATKLNPPVYYEEVDLSALRVDRSYQKGTEHSVAARIRDKRYFSGGWDDQKAAPLFVGRRKDGSLYIVDGQHRAEYAKMCGKTRLLVQLFDSAGPEHEASLFVIRNSAAKVSAANTFHARVTQGDPIALEIKRIIEKHGFVAARTTTRARGAIKGFAAVEALFQAGVLDECLYVVRKAWGYEEKALHNAVLTGVGRFLQDAILRSDNFKIERLGVILSLHTAQDIYSAAMKATTKVSAGLVPYQIAVVIARLYNAKLAARNRVKLTEYNEKD